MARGSKYTAYTGGPDPLAPPVDLREALEQIGQDVMEGTSPRRALAELLRRGNKNMKGADRLAAEVNRRRRELLSRNNLDGTLQEIKKLLDEAILAERKELARALDDDARFQEMQIESLPPSPAKAVQELSEYQWRSPEAKQKYEQIKDLLGREMLDQRFAGMKQALENASDEDRQAVNEMLDDLNDLLDKHAGGESDGSIRIAVDDVEVSETETRSQAVVALLVDTSFSMVMENRWLPMKRTALAVSHLVSTRFRSDALQIIAFGRHARTVTAAELTGLEGVYEQGTNLHHALALASRHLRRHPNAQPVVLVVTDGEPTAHLENYGSDGTAVFFDYPPHPRTIAHTVRGFDEIARLGAQVTIFRLGDDPGLARFIDQIARRVEGRVVVPELDGLGAAVVGDYLRSRRRRR